VKGRKSFICFDEDATVKSVKQAIDKGFDVPELVKRFAGVGLGPGQGGIPGHNLPLFIAKYTASGSTPRPTTVRPPLVPTFIATYAGYNHHMFKRTPLHHSQKADGGIFRNIGVWQRARYFSEDLTARMRSSMCATTWACWTDPPSENSAFTDPMPSRPSSGCMCRI
jgi:sarcosine oxidase subunit alpha